MYLDQDKAMAGLVKMIETKKMPKISQDDRILCLSSSTEGEEMKLLLKIADIVKTGWNEIFIIGEEPGKTALDKDGLFSLTIGFRKKE